MLWTAASPADPKARSRARSDREKKIVVESGVHGEPIAVERPAAREMDPHLQAIETPTECKGLGVLPRHGTQPNPPPSVYSVNDGVAEVLILHSDPESTGVQFWVRSQSVSRLACAGRDRYEGDSNAQGFH